jgi:hypothetical protein
MVEEFIAVIFTCLFFFYICKSAPGLAQGLLSGTPSLSATGAISAATGAVAAAGATLGLAKSAGSTVAGGIAKTEFAARGALAQASSASDAVRDMGGDKTEQRNAFLGSIAGSAGQGLKSAGHDLTRSLLADSGGRGGSGGGGINPHSERQYFTNYRDQDGNAMALGDYYKERKQIGADAGREYYNARHPKPEPDASGDAAAFDRRFARQAAGREPLAFPQAAGAHYDRLFAAAEKNAGPGYSHTGQAAKAPGSEAKAPKK